ncbi:MAG TPA: hypothetical protein P5136_01385 [Methanofastidiosum sp.]|nr:hypothetical protein [Methanofastidiosum sp.]
MNFTKREIKIIIEALGDYYFLIDKDDIEGKKKRLLNEITKLEERFHSLEKKKKVSDSKLWDFIFEDHGAEAFDFYGLQKKVTNYIMENPERRKEWEEKYLKEEEEMNS